MPNKLTVREVSLMPTPYVWNTHGVASKASYIETEKKKKSNFSGKNLETTISARKSK